MNDSHTDLLFEMTRHQLAEQLRRLSDELLDLPTDGGADITRIDRWALARRTVPCLVGVSTSHPRIGNGRPFFSSELYFLDVEQRIARSFSRWYQLGDPADSGYWEHRLPRQQ